MTKRIIGNTLGTLVIQIAVTFITLLMWATPSPAGEGISSLFNVPVMVAVGLLLYVVFGCLLAPLPKYNFLSVTGLMVALVIAFGPLQILAPSFVAELHSGFINMPASVAMGVLFEALGFLGDDYTQTAAFLVDFIAAFIPPLLMYTGLRLKMWRQKEGDQLDDGEGSIA